MSHRSVPQQRATIKAINAAPQRPSSTLALYILSLRKNIQGIVLHPKHPYPNKYALAVLKRTISEYNFEGRTSQHFPLLQVVRRGRKRLSQSPAAGTEHLDREENDS